MLQETFKNHYPAVKGAKVVADRLSGRSKGYGLVRFGDLNEQTRAMTEMNGVYCSSRPMRIGPAANKKAGAQQYSTNGRWIFNSSQFHFFPYCHNYSYFCIAYNREICWNNEDHPLICIFHVKLFRINIS